MTEEKMREALEHLMRRRAFFSDSEREAVETLNAALSTKQDAGAPDFDRRKLNGRPARKDILRRLRGHESHFTEHRRLVLARDMRDAMNTIMDLRNTSTKQDAEGECGAGAAAFDALEKAAKVAKSFRDEMFANVDRTSCCAQAAGIACNEIIQRIRALSQEGLVAGADGKGAGK